MTIFYYDVYAGSGQIQVPSDAAAIVAKATEGTYYRDSEYAWFKQQAANRSLPFSGYHFLNGNEDPAAQAAYYHDFAGAVPCMVDVEPEDQANSRPTLDQTVAFINALHGLGGRVWGVYFPQWYLNEVGGDLSRVTALGAVIVSSSYTGYSDTGPGWQPYGGATPAVWQYTSVPLDKNAFKGTGAQLAALFNGSSGSSTGADVNLTDTVTFSPAVLQQMPDLAAEGFGGSTTIETVWLWTAARVAETLNKVNDLEAKFNTLSTGNGGTAVLNAQQVADLVIAELKAKL